ncbi:MAG TPA: hypothetical protein VII92_20890 [Anaerolineae bacterium]
MTSEDTVVRDAAVKLYEAIISATKAGYRVAWPTIVDGLPAIAVSATAKVKEPTPKPATFGSPKSTIPPGDKSKT